MRRGTKFTGGLDSTSGSRGLSPDLVINYEMVGNWKEANFMLRTFPKKVDEAVNVAQMKFTRLYVKRVRTNIQNQGASLGWKPYSEGYREFKERHAEADTDSFYHFFNVLSRSIVIKKTGGNWFGGIQEGVYNSKMQNLRGETLSVSEYAGVLEHGSIARNIQPRPLWYPSFLQLGGKHGLAALVKSEIRSKFPSVRLRFPTGTKK